MEEQVNSNSPSRRERLATDAAMYMARALRRKGLKVVVDTPEKAREVYGRVASEGGPERFSVGDLMRLNYEWNGDEVSLRTFAQTFSDYIRQKDHTLEDAERIANAFLDAVEKDPASFVPQLKAENMSHARYFILNDGSVFGPEHPMYNSPEYETQRGLVHIYAGVLGKEDYGEYLRLLDPSRVRTPEEDERFVAMERKVSGSDIMQSSLEVNADRVNESRVKGISNLLQYFKDNPDYNAVEKALIVKGAMTWGVVEKKNGDANEVRIVRMTDSNDLSVPVIGGEAAAVAEGLRKGMNFKDALRNGRELLAANSRRSVPGTFSGWKVYNQSDREEDAAVLQQDAAGTGWCTGGALGTARSHLSGGDFHIYFEGGEPLIAIRTENGRMAEPPRGAHEGQFCTAREEQIAFDYIREGDGIVAGRDYVMDVENIRKIMSPDATWRDAFKMPRTRRYSNGLFGKDVKSWGDTVLNRIKTLRDSVSVDERHAEGYFLIDEVNNSNMNRVKYLDGSLDTVKGRYFPSLVWMSGRLTVKDNAYLSVPELREVMGSVSVEGYGWLGAPLLESVGGHLCVLLRGRLDAPRLRSVGSYLETWCDVTLDSLKSLGGDISIVNGTLSVPELRHLDGQVSLHYNSDLELLKIHHDCCLDAPVLESVDNYVHVEHHCRLHASSLKSVRGLNVQSNAEFDLHSLESVARFFNVGNPARYDLSSLRHVGTLETVSKTCLDLPSLRSVSNIYIYNDSELNFPSLCTVDNIRVGERSVFNAPALQSIGTNLAAYRNSSVNIPELLSVGNNLDVYKDASLSVPKLRSVGGLNVLSGSVVVLPALESVKKFLDVKDNAVFDAPSLQSLKGEYYFTRPKHVNCPKLGIVLKSFQISDGTVYGYALNDEIHLTPEGINPETPIHEYSHLWLQAYRKQYPGKWKSLCEVVESHGLDACVRNDPSYRYLKDDRDAVVEESVCRIVGSKGGDMLREMSFNADSVDQVVDRFRRLLVTYAVGEVFGKKMPSGVKDVGINVLRGFADITLPKQTLNVIVDRGRAADKQKKPSVLKL